MAISNTSPMTGAPSLSWAKGCPLVGLMSVRPMQLHVASGLFSASHTPGVHLAPGTGARYFDVMWCGDMATAADGAELVLKLLTHADLYLCHLQQRCR